MEKGKFICDSCGKEKPYGGKVGPRGGCKDRLCIDCYNDITTPPARPKDLAAWQEWYDENIY